MKDILVDGKPLHALWQDLLGASTRCSQGFVFESS